MKNEMRKKEAIDMMLNGSLENYLTYLKEIAVKQK